MSLKNQILNYLEEQGSWVAGGEVERLASSLGYLSSNSLRRCRELVNAGKIERELRRNKNGSKSVYYRIKNPKLIFHPPARTEETLQKMRLQTLF